MGNRRKPEQIGESDRGIGWRSPLAKAGSGLGSGNPREIGGIELHRIHERSEILRSRDGIEIFANEFSFKKSSIGPSGLDRAQWL